MSVQVGTCFPSPCTSPLGGCDRAQPRGLTGKLPAHQDHHKRRQALWKGTWLGTTGTSHLKGGLAIVTVQE